MIGGVEEAAAEVVDVKKCEGLSEDASKCSSEEGTSGGCSRGSDVGDQSISRGSDVGDQSTGDRKRTIESAATRLLTRLREERLFELRQLQHGARPVTREVRSCLMV